MEYDILISHAERKSMVLGNLAICSFRPLAFGEIPWAGLAHTFPLVKSTSWLVNYCPVARFPYLPSEITWRNSIC